MAGSIISQVKIYKEAFILIKFNSDKTEAFISFHHTEIPDRDFSLIFTNSDVHQPKSILFKEE